MNEIEKLMAELANMTDEDIANATEEQRKQFIERVKAAMRKAKPDSQIDYEAFLKLIPGATREGRLISLPSNERSPDQRVS